MSAQGGREPTNALPALVDAVNQFLIRWDSYGPGATYDDTDSGGLDPSDVDEMRAALKLARGQAE